MKRLVLQWIWTVPVSVIVYTHKETVLELGRDQKVDVVDVGWIAGEHFAVGAIGERGKQVLVGIVALGDGTDNSR